GDKLYENNEVESVADMDDIGIWAVNQEQGKVWGNTYFDFASPSAWGMPGVDGFWIPDATNIRWINVYVPQSLSKGDENTSFLYGSLKKKRRQLAIKDILMNEEWVEKPGRVKAEFMSHFRKRFQQPHGAPPSLDSDPLTRLSPAQSDYLERPITLEEIKRAAWDCGGDRAPGPNGFTFKFFTSFWDLIEEDVYRFVYKFFHTNHFLKGCNSSFISLIPKISCAKFVSDFQPISLIGYQYKIIGKILANRLSTVTESCVSPTQSAFIKGRNILDGLLILSEVLAWYRKCKKGLMVFKVDFEKAFESLGWDILNLILEKFGFGLKWCS
nr:cysteine-rich receptor-like protein kinase [Tanacetum cinerariifolium]